MKQQARKTQSGHAGRRVKCARCKKWRNVERCKQSGFNFVYIPCIPHWKTKDG